MPVIVVGADTPAGRAILDRLVEPDREVRAFVSDPVAAAELKERGVKVALGDLSDSSHVEGACTNCFSAVLVAAAAGDGRELAFARSTDAVLRGWAAAVSASGVRRAIWVMEGRPPPTRVPESAVVGTDQADGEIARRVAELDDAAALG